jgi:hypothetical protein
MDTQYNYDAPKVVTLDELETRRDEFDVPKGAVEAFKAGSSPVIVFMRSTGEEYQIASAEDEHPARTTLGPTSHHRAEDETGPTNGEAGPSTRGQ